MEEYDRFSLHVDDFEIIDINGKRLKGQELKKYLKKHRNLIVDELVDIGDVVKLKNFSDDIIVERNDGYPFKYGGVISGYENDLILFNQDDIVEVNRKTK